jgi:hypothetical protein
MLRDLNRAALTPPLRPVTRQATVCLRAFAYSIVAKSDLLSV